MKDVISMTEEEWLEEAAKHGYGSQTDSDSESQTDSYSEESGSEESGVNLGPN